jgi:hypothetical protein
VVSLPLQDPLAEQPVAFVLDQVSVAELPAAIVVGLTERVTVGAGTGAAATVNRMDLVAATKLPLPAKLAVKVWAPPVDGVSEQVAIPLLFVVAEQLLDPRVKAMVCPESAARGATETSVSVASTAAGVLIVPP